MAHRVEYLSYLILGLNQDHIARHVGRESGEFAGQHSHGTFADNDCPVFELFVCIVRQVKYQLRLAENPLKAFVDHGTVVRSPLNYFAKRLIEFRWMIDQCVDMTRFVP